MAASLLNRVKELTSGRVMVDGGALAGSGFGPGEMIECEVTCGIVPSTHNKFGWRGKLGVKYKPFDRDRSTEITAYIKPERVLEIVPEAGARHSSRLEAAAEGEPAPKRTRSAAPAARPTATPQVWCYTIRS